MSMLMRRLARSIWLLPLGVAACMTTRPPVERPVPVQGATEVTVTRQPPTVPRTAPTGLYAAEEALQDVLSGPWQYLGTGPWPGVNRAHACVFKNQRVLLVNVYCTITEIQAFRLDVYSPDRGHVRLYAESNGPVSKYTRSEYFTFTAESEPLPGPEAQLPRGSTWGWLRRFELGNNLSLWREHLNGPGSSDRQ